MGDNPNTSNVGTGRVPKTRADMVRTDSDAFIRRPRGLDGPAMRPDAVRVESAVGIESAPFCSIARVDERDGIGIIVTVFIELAEIDRRIGKVERLRQSLPYL